MVYARIEKLINKIWYKDKLPFYLWPFIPLSFLFDNIVKIRKKLQIKNQINLKKLINMPVIVIGNINVGGTGKTPVVIHVANMLKEQGYRPGIISRGYGGFSKSTLRVNDYCSPKVVGDEPYLIYTSTKCPVVIGENRVASIKTLIGSHDINVIISDDGLQHYKMPRDLEVVVLDEDRGFGNGKLLPVGPLRELPSRLKECDFVIINSKVKHQITNPRKISDKNNDDLIVDKSKLGVMKYKVVKLVNLKTKMEVGIEEFKGKKVHACAGIGNPKRFFSSLLENEIECVEHEYSDHHNFVKADFNFAEKLPILMTAKDAVKCKEICDDSWWYVDIRANISKDFDECLINKLESLKYGQKIA